MSVLKRILDSFNFKKQCRMYNVKLWQCPQFLFLVMGGVIILSIIVTYIVASRYIEPAIVILIVLAVTAILFIINYIIVSSFEKVVLSAKTKSDFISIMSHRLRTPLSAVKWQLNLLLNQKTDLGKEDINHSLLEIQNQNEKMIGIINNLLDLNFIEDNSLILYPTAFPLKKLVDEIVDLQKDAASAANLEIVVEAPEEMTDVFADRIKIRNVIYHLLDNAIRYSIKKGKININLENLPKSVKISINDEGVGISDKDAKRIFTKFFRSQETLPYQTEGTGICLFINKVIIEKLGGQIGFNSIEGRGSTFWFTLPAA